MLHTLRVSILLWPLVSVGGIQGVWSEDPHSTPARLPVYSQPGPVTGLRKLSDMPLRDTSLCRGPDVIWYLTGTVPPFWDYNEGLCVWKFRDMVTWQPLGMVWRYGKSAWHEG